MAADDASLLVADGPRVLAECLVELGGRLARSQMMGALRASGFSSHLGCRVERLMNQEGRAWSPPQRLRAALARSLGPAALAAAVILCSAWVAPRDLTKGDTMKSMQLNWKRTLGALAVAMSFNASAANAVPPGNSVAPPPGYEPAGASTGLVAGERAKPGFPGARLETKLKQMVLPEVRFDGLPLGEVLRYLSEQSRKLDPEKIGVNFLINPNPPPSPPNQNVGGMPVIDPTSGLPVAAAPIEAVDVSSISIKFNLPLRNVSMKDVLEAVVKVADHPIEYTLEDYAVIVSPQATTVLTPSPVGRTMPAPPLVARTFRVDTNTFIAGLESAFGIKVDTSHSRKLQPALRELLSQLGISLENGKSVFYNELTGVVMVRATPEDIELINAAIETLGGTVAGSGVTLMTVGPNR